MSAFVQREPHEGEVPSQRTEFRVAYDATTLYVRVRAFDAEPDKIVTYLTRRDDNSPCDWLRVFIDSYHDRRTAYEFAVNPSGVKQDRYWFNDGERDDSWDAVWDVSVTRDRDGWLAEFRIPFSQLRFTPGPPHIRLRGRPRDRPAEGNLDVAAAAARRHRLRVVVRRAERLVDARDAQAPRSPALHGVAADARADRRQPAAAELGTGRRAGARPEVQPDAWPDPDRHGQSGFRAGRGRSGGRQPLGVRDVFLRAPAVLHRRIGKLQFPLRQRSAVLLAGESDGRRRAPTICRAATASTPTRQRRRQFSARGRSPGESARFPIGVAARGHAPGARRRPRRRAPRRPRGRAADELLGRAGAPRVRESVVDRLHAHFDPASADRRPRVPAQEARSPAASMSTGASGRVTACPATGPAATSAATRRPSIRIEENSRHYFQRPDARAVGSIPRRRRSTGSTATNRDPENRRRADSLRVERRLQIAGLRHQRRRVLPTRRRQDDEQLVADPQREAVAVASRQVSQRQPVRPLELRRRSARERRQRQRAA